MADVITRLKLESGEYDSKIKRAVSGLQRMEDECRKVGGTLAVLEKDQLDYVRSLGNMETVSRNARGRLSELTAAFTELSMQYKRLTDEEKKGDFGKALNSSLSQLKTRINESKQQLADVSKELGETGVNMEKLGTEGLDLKSAMSTLGGQLGINTSLITGLSAGTMGAVAAIGALIAAEVKAAQAFAEYNEEIGKQSQVTTVTTGLSGGDAERMTAAARSLSKVYNTDFREVINAANTFMTQFGKSGDEAIELIRDGMQGMIMGDGPKLLSMIQQYAPSFRDAGIEASQLVAIIQNSEGGIFTDQNMNAIVMGIRNIRLMTKQTSEALAQLGIDGQKMSKQLNDGTLTIFDALQQVAGAIESVDSNSQAAGEVMQYVFGRQGTMAGTNLGKAIATLNTNLEETKRQTGGVGQATAELEQATERLDKAIRNCFGYDGWLVMTNVVKTDLTNAMADFLNVVNKVDPVLESISGKGVFEHMFDATIRSLGPLGILADKLKDIYKYTHTADLLKLKFGDEGTSTPSTSKLPDFDKSGAWGTTLNRLAPQTSTIADRPESVASSAAPPIKPINTDTTHKATRIETTETAAKELSIRQQISELEKEALTASRERRESIREQVLALDAELQKQKEIRDLLHTPVSEAETLNAQGMAYTPMTDADIKSQLDRQLKDAGSTMQIQMPQLQQQQRNEVKLTEIMSGMSSGISSMVSGIEGLGIELPQGLKDVVGGIQSVTQLLSAIMSIVSVIQAVSAADAIIPLAGGGIVPKAAGGMLIPGNSFSGDNLRMPIAGGGVIGVNSGELILNRSQQDTIASALEQSDENALGGTPYVLGETIYIGLTNYLRRTGRGELITANR